MEKYDKKVENILVSLKKPKTETELVKKHSKQSNISPKKVKKTLDKQLKKGEKIEKEHTKSKKAANIIARHHEDEKLNYYDQLKD